MINLWKIGAVVCAFVGCIQEASAESVVINDFSMRAEADSFLASMPVGLQQYQAEAIRRAIDGDVSELEAVRRSRNNGITLSDNVKTRDVSPMLRLYEPIEESGEQLPLLIYLHGGGWCFGSVNSCARFCDAIAASGAVKVLAVDYRLAPEYPYPAALDDCVAALQYAKAHSKELGIDAERITVGGDSAGGNLAVALACSALSGVGPELLLLFYPVTKVFSDDSMSWKLFGAGYGLDAGIMDVFNRAYAGTGSVDNPLMSVGLCDAETLNRLPRTLMIAAGRDILRDQGEEFAVKAGSRVKRVEFADAVHLFITVPGQPTAFANAVKFSLRFILDN